MTKRRRTPVPSYQVIGRVYTPVPPYQSSNFRRKSKSPRRMAVFHSVQKLINNHFENPTLRAYTSNLLLGAPKSARAPYKKLVGRLKPKTKPKNQPKKGFFALFLCTKIFLCTKKLLKLLPPTKKRTYPRNLLKLLLARKIGGTYVPVITITKRLNEIFPWSHRSLAVFASE